MPTALVIDDEPLIASFVQSLLPDWTVCSAVTGSAALAFLRDALVASTLPDLVVLDVHLPDIDGRDVCLQLRQMAPHLPVVPFTRLDPDELALAEFMDEMGCAPLIPKGVSPAILRHSLLLAAQQPAQTLRPGSAVLTWASHQARRTKPVGLEAQLQIVVYAATSYDRAALLGLLEQPIRAHTIVIRQPQDFGRVASPGDRTVLVGSLLDAQSLLHVAARYQAAVLLVARSATGVEPVLQACRAEIARVSTNVVIADDDCASERLQQALNNIAEGSLYRDPALEDSDDSSIAHLGQVFSGLSPRLLELIALDALNWSTSAIASRMNVSTSTIHTYWQRITERTGMKRADIRTLASLHLELGENDNPH